MDRWKGDVSELPVGHYERKDDHTHIPNSVRCLRGRERERERERERDTDTDTDTI